MDAIQLLLLSLLFFGIGALLSLLFNGNSRYTRLIPGMMGTIASGIGLGSAFLSAFSTPSPLDLPAALPFGHFTMQMDFLSTLLVGMISFLGLAANLYSISYIEHFSDRNLGVLGFLTNLFIAMMLLVVTVANAFYFLVFWELMTLTTYFLITFKNKRTEANRAGYVYMLMAHAGGALIMLSFFILFITTGSFEFVDFRNAQLNSIVKNSVFLLAFFGFGAKAGIVPLHIWMPSSYSEAPSHVTALMARVMKKTAIYGILRICVDIIGPSVLWWGLLVLFFGALSAIIGVLFAMADQDIKRILAYSSVENVGIILLGIGIGMLGLASRQPLMALLGFIAALYHSLNHSLYKGLLFLGAGSVDYRLRTRNLNEMGGLAKMMPWTAWTFMVGALALSAIPPLNGFVSEWFTYQAFLTVFNSQVFTIRVVLPLCAALLALTGALAIMVAVKVYGSTFTGPTRSENASQASEVPGSMISGMFLLALGCVGLGLGAPFIVSFLSQVVFTVFHVTGFTVSGSVWVYPGDSVNNMLSTPFVAILLMSLLVVPLILVAVYGGNKAGRRVVKDPWACGYGYSSKMSISAGNFDHSVATTFKGIYLLRSMIQRPFLSIANWSRRVRDQITRMEPVLEGILKKPITKAIDFLGQKIQLFQMGDVRVYCLYIILTLAILLVVVFQIG